MAARLRSDLSHHFGDGPRALAMVEVLAHRAELAMVTATAAKLDQAYRQVALAGKEIAPRHHPRLGDPQRAIVALPQPPLVRVGHHLWPERLAVACEDSVRVLGYLVGDECRVHPAHHHRHPARAKFGGDLIGAARGECLDIDGNQIGRLVVVDFIDAVVEQPTIDARRSQSGQDPEGERLHARLVDEPFAVIQAAERRLDEGHQHRASSRKDRSPP